MGHELRNLHDALVTYLTSSTLKNRFTVGFNPETSHWVIGFEKLSETEFKDIFSVASRLGLDPTQWHVSGNSEERQRTIRIVGLTSTLARDFIRAVALRFKIRTASPLSN
jgi:hypothetical protein